MSIFTNSHGDQDNRTSESVFLSLMDYGLSIKDYDSIMLTQDEDEAYQLLRSYEGSYQIKYLC